MIGSIRLNGTILGALDGIEQELRERLAEYYKLGARFAKWRAVINIGPGIPTLGAIDASANAMARYALERAVEAHALLRDRDPPALAGIAPGSTEEPKEDYLGRVFKPVQA